MSEPTSTLDAVRWIESRLCTVVVAPPRVVVRTAGPLGVAEGSGATLVEAVHALKQALA